jgi:hypothetical protein
MLSILACKNVFKNRKIITFKITAESCSQYGRLAVAGTMWCTGIKHPRVIGATQSDLQSQKVLNTVNSLLFNHI